MKFRIKRTSDWFSEERPCAGAKFISEDDDGRKLWTIEINTIEELLTLREQIGEDLILGWTSNDEPEDIMGAIEIYDSYRE